MKILLKNARILTMKNDQIIEGSLVVNNNRIAYIGNDYQNYGPFDREIDCKKNLLMPGFKNAHAHSAMVFLRGKADDERQHEWLFNTCLPREEHLIPEDVYALNKVAYLEYLTSGITAIFDYYFFIPMMAKSAEDFGIRSLLLGTYEHGVTSLEQEVSNYRKYNENKDSLVRFCVGLHSEYTADENRVAKTKEAIEMTHSPFFTHISETKGEVEGCIERHNMPPAKYLYENGLFAYGGGGYHCVHLTDEEAKIFKNNNLTIVTCPCSNAKLASGIVPITKYYNMGINIAIGTDGPASNNGLDMFKEMYLLASFNRLQTQDEKFIPAFEFLKMATVNGAKAMGFKDADVLDVNKLADIIMIDLSKPNMQPLNNIVTNLVYAGSKDNVIMTMINGKILYENGKYNINESIDDIYKATDAANERLEKAAKNEL